MMPVKHEVEPFNYLRIFFFFFAERVNINNMIFNFINKQENLEAKISKFKFEEQSPFYIKIHAAQSKT